MVELEFSAMSHPGDYEWLKYGRLLSDENRSVVVCARARSPRDEPMAFRLPHGLQDALRYTLRSQKTGLGSRVSPNGFDHRGAFGDALCIPCHGFKCDNNESEQQ